MDARRVLHCLLMDRDGNGCHASCRNVGDDVRHEYDGTQTGHDASCWHATRNARAYGWYDASQTGYDASSSWNASGNASGHASGHARHDAS